MLDPSPAGFGDKPDELDPDIFVSELPTQHSHAFFEDDSLGLYIGLWDTDDMVEAPGPYACDEFMLLLEGEVRVKDNQTGEFTAVAASDAFVLPKGYDCQWHQQGYLRKFYVISEHPDESVPDPAAKQQTIIIPLSPGNNARSESVLFPGLDSSNCTEALSYTDTQGRFFAGIWQSSALNAHAVALNHHCLLCVRCGAVTLATGEGEAHVSAGQTCFIPSSTQLAMSVGQETVIQFCTVTP